mgnify:FL=1
MANILIIDDEKEVGNFLSYLLKEKGYNVDVGYSGKDFDKYIREDTYHIALLDVKLPDCNGLDLLQKLNKAIPTCRAIVMTGYSTVKVAVEAIKLGASDYIEKPFDDIDELETMIDQLLGKRTEIPSHEEKIAQYASMSGIILGEHHQMQELLTLAYKIAPKNVNVLINGETGTGKELFAYFIHLASKRSENPFVGINCGAITETLLESELFGHERGAFTGATKERKGVFEIANRGTLFLDEVGDASLSTQIKLLRVVETGEFMRVGGERLQKTNTRIISATNVDLNEAVQKGTFREDLLYRLNVVTLALPPLRERKEDIPKIVRHFLDKQDEKLEIATDTMSLLIDYDWPGNVRELSNVIKHAVSLLEHDEKVITPYHLPERVYKKKPMVEVTKATEINDFEQQLNRWKEDMVSLWNGDSIEELDVVLHKLKQLELFVGKAYIMKTLKETVGDRKEAARLLNISERRLRYILNEKGPS